MSMEKFIQYEFQVFAPVRIGQIAGYAFLDTGAASSRIYQSYTSNLSKSGAAHIQGVLGTSPVEQCKLDRVTLLGQDFLDVVAKVQPDQAGGFQALPFPVVMTAGADILFRRILYLECAAGRVGFLESVPPEWEKRAQMLDLRFEKGYAFFNVSLGSHGLNEALDLSAGYSVLNARCLEPLQADLIEQQPEETSDSTGAKAWIPVFKHPALEVNGYALGGIRFLLMDLTAVEEALNVAVDFIFGFNAMVSHNWIVDKSNHRLLIL
jgi:hypothetical protein